ncbi:MAG: D-alanyl-D-alanine carboxypeptidase [Candidatus Sumerlaeia bacterium]|nr:D-alanyl-D-alanine carboxypeptidase [Candidatus Sumerlaeia bacterium]
MNPALKFFSKSVAASALLVSMAFAVSANAQTVPQAMDEVALHPSTLPNTWSVLFEDETGDAVYYSRNPDVAQIPASNMKMFTSAAAVELLGNDYVFETQVYRTGTLSGSAPNLTLNGNLVIIVEHDPTWNTNTLGSGNSRAGLDAIAQRVRSEMGISSITGNVVCQGAAAYNLGSTSGAHVTWTTAQPGLNQNAASALRDALIAQGVSVPSTTTPGAHDFDPPSGSTFMFTHQSDALTYQATGQPLTLEIINRPLNKFSHNAMADLMLRHIGWKLDTQSPPRDWYSVGGSFVLDWLENDLGMDTTGIVIADGSGWSGSNRLSASQTVQLTRYMVNNYPTWESTLPISGSGGTLSGRLLGSLSGQVYAKTGTLPNTGSVALSGYVDNPFNDRRYYFSIYTNRQGGFSPEVATIRGIIDDMVREIGLVRPPVSPDFYALRKTASGSVRVSWTDRAHEGPGYRVYGTDEGGSEALLFETSDVYIIESGSGGLNNGDYSETGSFEQSTAHSTAPGLTSGTGSRFHRPTEGTGTATFAPSALDTGRYRVDVTCFNFSSANAPNTRVIITDATGTRQAEFDLSNETAGNRWRSVGTFEFEPGQNHRVEFTNAVQATTDSDDRMNPAAVRFVPAFFEDDTVTPGIRRDYRVVALGESGGETDDSNIYTVLPGSATRVLQIDNYNRWTNQNFNPTSANHDFAAVIGSAIPLPFDTVANEAVEEGHVDIEEYDVVVWNFGEESTADRTFNNTLQGIVTSYLSGGGHMFLSGSEIAWDLGRTAASNNDKLFLENVLRVQRFTAGNPEDDADTNTAQGSTGNIFAGISQFTFGTGPSSPYPVNFPDILNPFDSNATPALSYVGGKGGPAAITVDDGSTGKIVYLGFPVETITNATVREEILAASFDFFLPASSVDGWMLLAD